MNANNQSTLLRELSDAVRISDLRRAAEIASGAIDSGAAHPAFHNARALWAEQQGQYQLALGEFQRALTFTPSSAVLLSAIGLCLVRMNRVAEGIVYFDRSLAIEPNDPDTHYRKGWALANAGDQAAARQAYERAIALRPDFPQALAALAAIAARDGRREEARSLADRALSLSPREPAAIVALSICDIAERNHAAAEQRLAPMLGEPNIPPHTRALMLGFHADALDGLGRYAEAFAEYSAKNEELRRIHAGRMGPARTVQFVDMLDDCMMHAPAEVWSAAPPATPGADDPRSHVFLLGFLRSGTTLLEQILAMDPAVAVSEERETLSDAAQRYLTGAEGLARLAAAPPDELDRARAIYWSRVRSHGIEPAGKVLIDKQPLNTFNLPLIARLFPTARILFALRDPRDVVLSCFRRHFEVNATVFELLALEDAARFYSSVMNLAQTCRERLPLVIHDHRYEDMVADFDTHVRAACDFAGITWSQSMRDFGEAARARTIRSPSAAQVRRELYGEGVGQWRNYREGLAPVLGMLAPWVERFGYPAD
ncbi:MAG TPA: sulfotransferase [Rhizomicrobium sp.]|nr:sulfotransferase [Rhizomicrobium sp.]